MINIIQKQFNKLLVLEEKERRGYYRYFLCRCDCGNKIITRLSSLTTGATKSCGCLQKQQIRFLGLAKRKHGMTGTRFYKIWKGLFTRCYNSRFKLFKDYGGRGIKVCERWHKFENFRDDMVKNYRDNLSIERINNNGNYELSNCKWATRKEQNMNKRMQKLTREKVKEIRGKYKLGNGKLLAKEYGVCPAVISEIVNYKRNYSAIC